MQAESSGLCQNIKPHRFVALLGRYFQIRDDYQNLTADEYIKTKGFCEDLDEGKISLPLIYTLQKAGAHQATLRGVFHNEAFNRNERVDTGAYARNGGIGIYAYPAS